MLQLTKMRLIFTLFALLATAMPALLRAQDDPNEIPLGDVARALRQQAQLPPVVIDDDNLSTVIEQADSRRAAGSALTFLMGGRSRGFQVSGPDVTCSLNFTANVKSLLSGQYAQMELPPKEVVKLQGPATIEGDALTVSVFNGTDWHVSEVVVALTIIKKGGARDASLSDDALPLGPNATPYAATNPVSGVSGYTVQDSEVRPEKRPDLTVIYRMRAAAAPFSSSVFSAQLNRELTPDEEWHWAIVQAKGYPPQSYGSPEPQSTAQSALQSAPPPAAEAPQNAPAVSPRQDAQ